MSFYSRLLSTLPEQQRQLQLSTKTNTSTSTDTDTDTDTGTVTDPTGSSEEKHDDNISSTVKVDEKNVSVAKSFFDSIDEDLLLSCTPSSDVEACLLLLRKQFPISSEFGSNQQRLPAIYLLTQLYGMILDKTYVNRELQHFKQQNKIRQFKLIALNQPGKDFAYVKF